MKAISFGHFHFSPLRQKIKFLALFRSFLI
nr:MAG TPA: hypothetical protein [Caudoviricetes sp.]